MKWPGFWSWRRAPVQPPNSGEAELFDADFLRQLEPLVLALRRAREKGRRGQRRSSSRGQGLEFRDFRPYAPGDELRKLDWSLWARTSKYYVREQDEEEDRQLLLLLDASASLAGPPFWQLRRLAAAWAYVSLAVHDRVGLGLMAGGELQELPALRGRQRSLRLFRFLAAAQAAGRTQWADSVAAFLRHPRPRVQLVVMSDLLAAEGLEAALLKLLHSGHELTVVALRPGAAPGARGLHELEDAESGELLVQELGPQTAELMREAWQNRRQQLEGWCRARGVSLVDCEQEAEATRELLRFLEAGVLR